jgi:hypothetical protein
MAKGHQLFGLLTATEGSYTLGDVRFLPFLPIPVSKEAAGKACKESSPVAFFESEEAAVEAAGKLRAAKAPKG